MSGLMKSAPFLGRAVLASAMLFAGAAPSLASGFNDPRIDPKPVPQQPDTSAITNLPSSEPVSVQDGDRVILPALKGMAIVNGVSAVRAAGVPGSGVMVHDLPMLDEPVIHEKLAAFIDKPLTQNALHAIGQAIIDWYRDQNYPFVDVAVPAGQDVTNGVVQIVVTESKAGRVTARGNRWFSSDLLVGQVRLAPGDRINIQDLEADKNWINQNPFRQVNIVAERDDAPGVTNFIIDTVEEKFPLRAYVGYDNSGTPILGHDRWNVGFAWGNVFGLDHQFSYQFTSSDDFWHKREQFPGKADNPSFIAHSVSYAIPLPWRDRLTIYGSYMQASPLLGPFLGITGTNGVAGIRYEIQLPSNRQFDERLQLGYEFKTSNNDLAFGGFVVNDVTSEINQFLIDYDAVLRDDYGQTSVDNTLVFSPGGITSQNKDLFFGAQIPFAKANYIYDHIVITRVTGLPKDSDWAKSLGWFGGASIITKFVGQIANGNLLPSEQLGIGGADSVRGYDERAENGSEGMLFSLELRSPSFSLAKSFLNTNSPYNDQTQLAAFFDYGTVSDNVTLPGSPKSIELDSAGLGLHMLAGPDQNLRLDLNYGWQLRKLPFANELSQFGHVSVTAAY